MTPKMHLDFGIQLVHQGDLDNAITAFCTAITLDPTYSPAYNNLGLILRNTNRLLEAEACFCRAIELTPDDASAYNNLGLVLMDLEQLEKAKDCFQKAIELNPYQAAIHNNFGTVLEELEHMEQAQAAYEQALSINPTYPEAYHNLGTFFKTTQNFVKAEAYLCRALELRPGYLDAELALANLYLLENKFEEAWVKYESSRPRRFRNKKFSLTPWCDEPLTNCSILLYWEYGFGDTMQFARYVKKVEQLAAKVSLWVQKPLERLITAEYPHLTVYVDEEIPSEPFDYACSFMSLPARFATDNDNIPPTVPYDFARHTPLNDWNEILKKSDTGTSCRVGVVWAGHPKHFNDGKRSISFPLFRPLFEVANINWVSLQVGIKADDINETPYQHINFSKQLVDFMETAYLIEQLDLVITVDSAVSHLAGTLGKETWLLLSFDHDWRWQLERLDSPWYPTVKIFRQKTLSDWQEVIESVTKELQKRTTACI